MKRVLFSVVILALLTASAEASIAIAVRITPTTEVVVAYGDDPDGVSDSAEQYLSNQGATELYKNDRDNNVVSGSLMSSYETTYYSSVDYSESLDAAEISHVAGMPVVAPPSYLTLKDGNSTPNWYVFDLQNLKNVQLAYETTSDGLWNWEPALDPTSDAPYKWDGIATLVLEEFFLIIPTPTTGPKGKDISNVSLWGTVGEVPEPASLAIWAVIAAGGAAVAGARKRRGRWAKANREAILGIIQKA